MSFANGVHSVEKIYHEKQVKKLCALHSLNNLFQDASAFSKDELDKICEKLSPDHWINPHKSVLGTGNYDINVIIAALEAKGCAIVWFDKRKDPGIIVLELVMGFILNIPSEYRVGPVQLPLRRKHWVAVKKVNNLFYNLDSKLDAPVCIGQANDLLDWLRVQLSSPEKELFIVAPQDVEKNKSWCLEVGAAAQHIELPSTPLEEETKSNERVDARLVHLNNVECTQDVNLQKRVLAPLEGEEAFSSPGLKFIDQDAASVDSGNLRRASSTKYVSTSSSIDLATNGAIESSR
ncbi:josephin-1 [Hyalella azteca]|uniref:Josephin-2 n=1 Tax=Hyalella azteca TaxID=294128 RepID=A0A8B7NZR8_HYAAZ|nr:josephin-1 [Hyalella azteca]